MVAMTRSVIELAAAAAQVQRPSEALTAISELRTRLEELEELHVEDALRRGLTWSQIAAALGVSRQAVHKKYARTVGAGRPMSQVSRARGMLITAEARRCVFHARREAAGLGHREVGTAHLLLGFLREEGTPAHEALTSLGITHADARAEIRAYRRAHRGDKQSKKRPVAEKLPVSEAARRVFEQALREAVRIGDKQLAAEHLLLAALREQGVAVKVLERLGVSAADLEQRVDEVLDMRRVRGRNVRLHA